MSKDHVIVGIDPGGRYTGVVSINLGGNNKLRSAAVFTREDQQTILSHAVEVCEEISMLVNTFAVVVVRIEDVVKPTGHMGMMNPETLFQTSKVIGFIAARFPDSVEMVRPGGNGSRQPLRECYPTELIGPRERTGTGNNPLKHARSAYDVAMTFGEPAF